MALPLAEGATLEINPPAATEAEPTPRAKRKVAKKNLSDDHGKKEAEDRPRRSQSGLGPDWPNSWFQRTLRPFAGHVRPYHSPLFPLPVIFFSFPNWAFAVPTAGELRGCDCIV